MLKLLVPIHDVSLTKTATVTLKSIERNKFSFLQNTKPAFMCSSTKYKDYGEVDYSSKVGGFPSYPKCKMKN